LKKWEKERKRKEKYSLIKRGNIINKGVGEGDPPLLSLRFTGEKTFHWGTACDTGAVVERVGANDV